MSTPIKGLRDAKGDGLSTQIPIQLNKGHAAYARHIWVSENNTAHHYLDQCRLQLSCHYRYDFLLSKCTHLVPGI